MRGRAHSRDEGGFGRVVAASAVLLALLSGIVVMMLGAVGHMARMTSPGLANLGSPAARERNGAGCWKMVLGIPDPLAVIHTSARTRPKTSSHKS